MSSSYFSTNTRFRRCHALFQDHVTVDGSFAGQQNAMRPVLLARRKQTVRSGRSLVFRRVAVDHFPTEFRRLGRACREPVAS